MVLPLYVAAQKPYLLVIENEHVICSQAKKFTL